MTKRNWDFLNFKLDCNFRSDFTVQEHFSSSCLDLMCRSEIGQKIRTMARLSIYLYVHEGKIAYWPQYRIAPSYYYTSWLNVSPGLWILIKTFHNEVALITKTMLISFQDLLDRSRLLSKSAKICLSKSFFNVKNHLSFFPVENINPGKHFSLFWHFS